MTPLPDRLHELARQRPDATVVTLVNRKGGDFSWRWRDLMENADSAARDLRESGVIPGDIVAIALPASLRHVAATIGAWQAGAVVLPLPPAAPQLEIQRILDIAAADFLVDREQGVKGARRLRPSGTRNHPLTGAAGAEPRSVSLTGGSTGEPKVVVGKRPWVYDEAFVAAHRGIMEPGDVQLIVTALHHWGFHSLYGGLMLGQHIVLLEHFVPRLVLSSIQKYAVNQMCVIPTQMKWLLDSELINSADLSSLRTVHHSGGPCPEQVKRKWIKLLGPERILESYTSHENLYSTYIRGQEWLAHPGSVGRPGARNVRIVLDSGAQAAPGEIGEVFLRPHDGPPQYIGPASDLPAHDGKYLSLGDLGYLDEDGYLYLVDRANEMFISGAENIYPRQIEMVLLDHPAVRDAMVVGAPHDDLGLVAKAYVVPAGRVTHQEIIDHCRPRLSGPRLPRYVEFVSELPRAPSGKMQRYAAARRTDGVP